MVGIFRWKKFLKIFYQYYIMPLFSIIVRSNKNFSLTKPSEIISGSAPTFDETTKPLIRLVAASGIDDGGYVIPILFNFYFFNTNYGNYVLSPPSSTGVYWCTNNVIGFGTPNSTITWNANTGRGIIIGNADRRTNNFYYSDTVTSGNWNYINCFLYAQNNYSDNTPNAIKWQIRIFNSPNYQMIEVRQNTIPSTAGSYNITNGSAFQNTFTGFTPSSGQSFVLWSDGTGSNWNLSLNSYVNI